MKLNGSKETVNIEMICWHCVRRERPENGGLDCGSDGRLGKKEKNMKKEMVTGCGFQCSVRTHYPMKSSHNSTLVNFASFTDTSLIKLNTISQKKAIAFYSWREFSLKSNFKVASVDWVQPPNYCALLLLLNFFRFVEYFCKVFVTGGWMVRGVAQQASWQLGLKDWLPGEQ